MEGKQYTFYYFPLSVRGEPMRMLLSHANVPFNNNIVQFKDWPALKPSMPNMQMPCLELADGTKMGQSHAILRFLGAKHGYYPSDALEAY